MRTEKIEKKIDIIRAKMLARFDEDESNESNEPETESKPDLSTRLPYGLCKSEGIKTVGMTPREAWAAYYKKTGIGHDKALKDKIEKESAKEEKKEKKEEKQEKPKKTPEEEKKEFAEKETRRLKEGLSKINKDDNTLERKTKVADLLKSAPGNTVVNCETWLSRTYKKKDDGSWVEVNSWGDRDVTEDIVTEQLAGAIGLGREHDISVKNPIKFSADHVKEWAESLGDASWSTSEIRDAMREMPDGTVVWGAGGKGACAVKKSGLWHTAFGYYSGSPSYIVSSVLKGENPEKAFTFDADGRTALDGPKTDLDKSLSEKLRGDLDTVGKTLRSMKEGDKITAGFGDHSIEFKRVKGGFTASTSPYHKWKIDEVADDIYVAASAPGMSVTVSAVPRPKKTPKTPEEKAAAKALKEKLSAPYVPTGAKYESPDSLENFDDYIAGEQGFLKMKNNITDEDINVIRRGMSDIFKNHEYGMRFDGGILKKIMDTHFMNQMESKSSKGWHDEHGRAKTSRNLFGNDKYLDKTGVGGNGGYFEKYGFMPDNPEEEVGRGPKHADWYGDVLVTFKKDRVAPRTTYTCSDSLSGDWNPSSRPGRAGEDPGWEGTSYNNAKNIANKFRKAVKDGTSLKPSDVSSGYLELQYHGRLTFDDVDAVYFTSYGAGRYLTDEIEKRLRDTGVKIYVDGRGYI